MRDRAFTRPGRFGGDRVTPALILLLARLCVSETGWNAPNECRAIVHVVRTRAEIRGTSIASMARAYAPGLTRPRTPRQQWIAALHPDQRAPKTWPRGASWERHRVRLQALAVVVADALAEQRSSCVAEHWSAPHCRACNARMVTAGYVPADCGRTSNVFWIRRRD